MGLFRTYLRANLWLAAAVVCLALCVKAIVPTGYMAGGQGGALGIQICGGQSGGAALIAALEQRGINIPGKASDQTSHERASNVCPFGALSMAADVTVPPVLLAAAIVFILAMGFAPAPQLSIRQWPRPWPPLRGPPFLT